MLQFCYKIGKGEMIMTKVFKGRSTLFIAIAFCLVALLKVTPVNAAETWGLFIFDDSTSTL